MECLKKKDLQAIRNEQQAEQDKDLMIAELMLQNANLQQQINDMSLIVADMMTKGGVV